MYEGGLPSQQADGRNYSGGRATASVGDQRQYKGGQGNDPTAPQMKHLAKQAGSTSNFPGSESTEPSKAPTGADPRHYLRPALDNRGPAPNSNPGGASQTAQAEHDPGYLEACLAQACSKEELSAFAEEAIIKMRHTPRPKVGREAWYDEIEYGL